MGEVKRRVLLTNCHVDTDGVSDAGNVYVAIR